jgi:hypothetical protein
LQVSNGAVTAGELAYGGRLKALEATVDTLEATIRGQEQELNEMRWQNNCLSKEIKNNEERSEKLLEKIQLLKRRFTSACIVLQVKPCLRISESSQD